MSPPVSTSGSASASANGGLPRKPVRKGTRSCIECRRRKIRCIFQQENSRSCSRCTARGLRCIDQRNSAGEPPPSDEKTLRDRVARLESLLELALTDRPEGQALVVPEDEGLHDDHASDGEDFVVGDDTNAPFIRALDKNMQKSNNSETTPSFLPTPAASNDDAQGESRPIATSSSATQRHVSKKRNVCQQLRSTLPPYDQILKILADRGNWWESYNEKTFGNTRPIEPLGKFAAHAYYSDSPEHLGLLVAAFGRSATQHQSRYFTAVENLVVAENEFAVTMAGLECIILLGKCYLDLAQPRRAWLVYRRGLTLAELTDLPRNYTRSVERACIWWSIFQGDRFVSLLLGLPYGIADAHCDLDVKSNPDESGVMALDFIIKSGIVCGRIIDRNQSVKEPPLSITTSLNEEMDSIHNMMPEPWWEISNLMSDPTMNNSSIRARLLAQIYFFHLKMYLHMPFMLKSRSDGRYKHNRALCTGSARELLRRYQMLRWGPDGEVLFDCLTNDFVAFTASVILLLGSLHHSSEGTEDWLLLESCRNTLREVATEKGARSAVQCHKALELLVAGTETAVGGQAIVKVFVPYFGTVTIAPGTRTWIDPIQPAENLAPASLLWDFIPQSHEMGLNTFLSNPPESEALAVDHVPMGMDWIGDNFGNGESTAWWATPMVDLDVDWSLFLPG